MKPRDVELLSAYLDGQLSLSDSSRLESRLRSEPELVSVMDDLRAARGYLRKLPLRRAPRNFTLTRKMVGQNPPLPRAYPVFRFTTAIATLLFFLTYGFNVLAPQFAAPAWGRGGGGPPEVTTNMAPAADATEAPAAEAPLYAPEPTMSAEAAPSEERIMETPTAKDGAEPTVDLFSQSQLQEPPQEVAPAPPQISAIWQYILLAVAIVGALFMVLMRRISARRWK